MAEAAKNQSLIIDVIKPPQPPARFSTESLCDGFTLKLPSSPPLRHHRVPFFRPLSQRRGANTWVISFFVVVHLILFTSTMLVNNCGLYSHGDCAFRQLGRFSFQHFYENPLLGPSASALDEMGALRERYITKKHEYWRIFTCPWLHSGFGHLIINLSSVIFIGTHLEQDFGSLRIGVIYLVSAHTGSTLAVLFLQDRPSVASSCVLFGLLGAMLSALIRNWKFYTKKSAASITIFVIFSINILLGLLPYINNFANVGGLLSGFLLGFALLFSPEMGQNVLIKGGLYEYEAKYSDRLKLKLDRPVLRIISLVFFSLLLSGVIVAVLRGINVGQSCSWCHYIDCLPCKWWSCSDKTTDCETTVSSGQLTMTCTGTDKFRVFPFTNTSQARMEDLCNLICS